MFTEEKCMSILGEYKTFREFVLEKLNELTRIQRVDSPYGDIIGMYLEKGSGFLHIDVEYRDCGDCTEDELKSYALPLRFLVDPDYPDVYRIPYDKIWNKKEEERLRKENEEKEALMKRRDEYERTEYNRLKAKFEG